MSLNEKYVFYLDAHTPPEISALIGSPVPDFIRKFDVWVEAQDLHWHDSSRLRLCLYNISETQTLTLQDYRQLTEIAPLATRQIEDLTGHTRMQYEALIKEGSVSAYGFLDGLRKMQE